jgi:hypothetical protein
VVVAVTQQSTLDVSSFITNYLNEEHYELIAGELVDLEPTGLHVRVASPPEKQVTGFVNRKLNVGIELSNQPWFIPMKCLIQPLGQNSAYRPEVIILDRSTLNIEPLWKKEPVITFSSSAPTKYLQLAAKAQNKR